MTDLLKDRVAANLRRLRTELGEDLGHEVTQTELAERAGVSWKAYQRWESGRNMPRQDALEALAETFGVNTSDIYGIEPTADDAELRAKLDHMEQTIKDLTKAVHTLIANGHGDEEMVAPSVTKALLDKHDVTLTELAARNDWLLPDGRPDPTKAGREIGHYGAKPKPREKIERLLITVGIDPGELDQ